MRLKAIVTVLFGVLMLGSKAQDIHYTLYDSYSLYLNPALAGHFQGTWRFTANHKQQWRSVTTPYRTFSLGIDKHFALKNNPRNLIGGGFCINRDIAGDSEFGTTQPALTASFIRILDDESTKFLSVGIENSAAQRTINYEKLTFDQQFDGFTYNPGLHHGEVFPTESFWFYDLRAGIHYMQIMKEGNILNAGFAASHINRPKQTMFNNKEIKLDAKFAVYANYSWNISDNEMLLPGFLYSNQGKYRELILNFVYKNVRNEEFYKYSAIYAGAYFRAGDAINIMLGMDQRRTFIALSYDINISGLHPASNHLGGVEIAIVHKLHKVQVQRVKDLPCPIF